MLYVPHGSSFISTQFGVCWFGVLSNRFIIFWYHNCITEILDHQWFAAFFGYISFWIYMCIYCYSSINSSISYFTFKALQTVLSGSSWDFFSFISNFITNEIISYFCCFVIYFLEVVLFASVANCLWWLQSFWLYLLLKFLLAFLPVF